ncbi:MAG TPA: 4-hydroxy-tetrahydrodipicolinate reductase [bacterium]|nr:4-hydroxy-tetrahydrodipicolinate reductase [bacterium]
MGIGVLVNGAKGKMGREIVLAVQSQPDMELIAQTDLGDDLSGILRDLKIDVAVDFTHPDCAFRNARLFVESGKSAVIGTTGFKETELRRLHEMALDKNVGLLIAPNFCTGAVLMMRFAEEAARFMNSVEVVEMHHTAKVDAPSGTAKLTADKIAQVWKSRGIDPVKLNKINEFRGGLVSGIPVHSVRLDGLMARQEVMFGGDGQTLEIRHNSQSRSCFMPGILQSVRAVRGWKGLVYGLDRLLFAGKDGIQTGL